MLTFNYRGYRRLRGLSAVQLPLKISASASTMGCGSTKLDNVQFTDRNKNLVKMSWEEFAKCGDLTDSGIPMYVKLFQDNPEIKSLFSFMRDGDASTDNPQYRAHVKRVLDVVGTAAMGVHELGEVLDIVRELGGKHCEYGVQASQLKPVGEALLYALQCQLKDKFTNDVKNSWLNFYTVLSAAFIEGLESEAKKRKT